MDEIDALIAHYRAGETVSFGPQVMLAGGILHIHDTSLSLNTLEVLRLDGNGNAQVRRLGCAEPPLIIKADEVDGIALFMQVVNHLIAAIPYIQRRSASGWPPGSIGDLSARIGYDVRELLIVGYTDAQIRGLTRKEYTLEELLKQRPKGPPMVLTHEPGSRRRKPAKRSDR